MSLKLQMLQVATLAPRILGDSTELIVEFINKQLTSSGAFKNRAGESDLYYTLFGLECKRALQLSIDLKKTEDYLSRFGSGDALDLVHLCCLARTWSNLNSERFTAERRSNIAINIDTFKSNDDGYHLEKNQKYGTAYAAFMVLDAMQSLNLTISKQSPLISSIQQAHCKEGGYSMQKGMQIATTPTTAAAIVTLQYFNQDIPDESIEWLKSMNHPQGGFRAAKNVIVPDLLSTATALHSLSALKLDFESHREPCLDFIDSLWTNSGGFYGSWEDEYLDVEYLFYALLALGHLSV